MIKIYVLAHSARSHSLTVLGARLGRRLRRKLRLFVPFSGVSPRHSPSMHNSSAYVCVCARTSPVAFMAQHHFGLRRFRVYSIPIDVIRITSGQYLYSLPVVDSWCLYRDTCFADASQRKRYESTAFHRSRKDFAAVLDSTESDPQEVRRLNPLRLDTSLSR